MVNSRPYNAHGPILGRNVDAPDESNPFAGSSPRRFVREVNSDRVYVTTLDQGFSTKFIDWVETDLLKLDRDDLRVVSMNNYSIDEAAGLAAQP
jgi:hypothetical protein